MITDEWRLRLEHYLDGALSADEQASVEQALEADDELFAELNVLRLEREAMRLAYEENLRKKVTGWVNEEAARETPVRSLHRWIPLSVAAGILLIAGVFGLQRARNLYSNDALLGQFTTRTIRSASAPSSPTARAALAIQRDSFRLALQLLQEVEAPGFEEYVLQAEAYKKLKDFPSAARALQQAQNQTSNPIELQELDWNLIGLFIASGRDSLAIRQLEVILNNPQHDFYEPAKELRRRLQSPWRRLAR